MVRGKLEVRGNILRSKETEKEWTCGQLEIVSLADLRKRAKYDRQNEHQIKIAEVVGDTKSLHADSANTGALFQVASQFNLLEMVSPNVSPDEGIAIYSHDPTQGPVCAIACAAGTVYRNYFVELDGQLGQSSGSQVDCLDDIGRSLGNADGRLWRMQNGYALPTRKGLQEIDDKLSQMSGSELDELRGRLKIGLQWDTQVTLDGCGHLVTQAYCSALPVAYSDLPVRQWERFARLILEAAYEATFAAAMVNRSRTRNNALYLTLLGGGAFGNAQTWILDSIHRAANLYRKSDLNVRLVSYRESNPAVRKLCNALAVS